MPEAARFHPSNHRPEDAGSIRNARESLLPVLAACLRAFRST